MDVISITDNGSEYWRWFCSSKFH